MQDAGDILNHLRAISHGIRPGWTASMGRARSAEATRALKPFGRKNVSNELVTKELNPQWEVTKKQARAFLMSGYLREEFTKGIDLNTSLAKVLTIIQMADELGIGRMQGLRSINVIKGKPALSAELMLALAYKKIPGLKVTFTTPPEKQKEVCSVIVQRPGGDPSAFSFAMTDAHSAGLVKPDSGWSKYPQDMLRARVLTRAIRAIAPDATMGLMSLEELGSEVVEMEASTAPIGSTTLPQESPFEPTAFEQSSNTPGYNQRHDERMGQPATEAQQKKLYAMCKAQNIMDSDIDALVFDVTGIEDRRALSKTDIQKVFLELENGSAH